MYICLCKGITDSHIRAQAQAGNSFSEARRNLGLASQCGKCGIEARAVYNAACIGSQGGNAEPVLFYPAAIGEA